MDIKLNVKLLKKSIKHWEHNLGLKNIDDICIGAKYCALCVEFNVRVNSRANYCEDCCIFVKTGKEFCGGTAYVAIRDQRNYFGSVQRLAVERMLQFLKDLLVELEGSL